MILTRLSTLVIALAVASSLEAQVHPMIQCWSESAGTLTVKFGCLNLGATAVTIPVGANNFMSPPPAANGQPTTFAPGSCEAFTATFDVVEEHAIAWTLDGRVADLSRSSDPECGGCFCPVGPAGPEGPRGPEGPSGPQGETDAQGTPGETGPPGTDGVAGATGPSGLQGLTGPQGPEGADGAEGDAGAIGPAGAAGAMGPEGPAGPDGASGAEGIAGAEGSVGVAGVAGEPGAMGQRGATGPAGPEGPAGIVGVAGPEGSRGAAGVTGVAGASGARGPQGPEGAEGAEGAIGPAGTIGIRGEMGATGAAGAQGDAGPAGSPGADASVSFLASGRDEITVDRTARVLVTGAVVARGTGALTLMIGKTAHSLRAPVNGWSTIQILVPATVEAGTHTIKVVATEGVEIEGASISAVAMPAEPRRRRAAEH